jgi:hypothetical protein
MNRDLERRARRLKVRTCIEVSEVYTLLRMLGQHRAEADRYTRILHEWLKCSDDFAEAWTAFSAAGGISAEDFYAFINNQFPGRSVKQQKHLRLVTNNTMEEIQ